MAFRLRQGEDAGEGISRIVKEQIERGLREIDNPDIDPHETVHQVRKRCKKIRSVLRLAKSGLGNIYGRENRFFKDAAHSLSGVRDAEALIETYDKLMELYADELDRRAFQSVRRALTMRKRELVDKGIDLDSRLSDFKAGFEEATTRVDEWPLGNIDRDVIIAGATQYYAKARNAMKTARKKPSVSNLHEWRKRTKDHWYHLRVLRDIWHPVVGKIRNAAEELADLLGDDHNLAVLQTVMHDEPDRFETLKGTDAMMRLLNRQRTHLIDQAMINGQRLYAGKAKAFKREIESYWDAWREDSETGNWKLETGD